MDNKAENLITAMQGRLANASGNPQRLLVLEVRPRRCGFVVFEGMSALLDWGVRRYGSEPTSSCDSIEMLLEIYSPDVVVMRRRRIPPHATRAVGAVMKKVSLKARQHSAKVRFVSVHKIQHVFERLGCETRHDIASVLAKWFKEIAWKLPRKRRAWESERYNSVLFDGVATGIAFLAMCPS